MSIPGASLAPELKPPRRHQSLFSLLKRIIEAKAQLHADTSSVSTRGQEKKLATTLTPREQSEGYLNYSNKAQDVINCGSAVLWGECRAAQFVNGCHQTFEWGKNQKCGKMMVY